MSDAFRTFQTPSLYEGALKRHAQWIRWLRAIVCPCLGQTTRQPDPHCTLCKGRGHIYRRPGPFKVLQEIVRHDSRGYLYPKNLPVTGGISATHQGQDLSIVEPQTDPTRVQIEPPYPAFSSRITLNYGFDPVHTVVGGAVEFVKANVLRVTGTDFIERGKGFTGSLDEVTRVRNVTKAADYPVESFNKDFIVLSSMGTGGTAYVPGDVLIADYVYVKAFPFLFHGVSQRMRYDRAYVLEDADAILVTPHWAQPSVNDLFTMLSGTQEASAVLDPTFTDGNDVIRQYFDIESASIAVDLNGIEYVGETDFTIVNRNEVKWLVSKPTVKYSIDFSYHPTFVSIANYDTVRTSENKSFVNRLNLKQFDSVNTVVRF